MIVVIADDLSGAAELAGVARGAGLTAEVQTDFNPATEAAVVAVDTNTRTIPEAEAVARVTDIAARVAAHRPDWIYKKTDSVLRGHVVAECRAIARATGRKRVALIPANPGRQRVIRDGRYWIGTTPLDQSPFADDPQWPARSARVLELLRGDSTDLHSLRPHDILAVDGVSIPDVWEPLHLRDRARQIDDQTLPAGAMEFFSALLHRTPISPQPSPPMTARSGLSLFACGSHAAWSGSRLRDCQNHAIPVVPMPRRIFADDHQSTELDRWATEVVHALAITGRAMVAVGGEKIVGMPPGRLESRLADVVRRVIQQTTIGHLFIEGGATAAALLHACGWRRLRVGTEIAPGLARLEVVDTPAPLLLIKPGSYDWPERVLAGSISADD